jgi:hypothetical protein
LTIPRCARDDDDSALDEIQIFPIDTRAMNSYCIVPSTPRGEEECRSSSGVLVDDWQMAGRCASAVHREDQPS